MKEMFKWYFPITDEEIKDIWDKGLLTVDTNVLLDLYRYHQDTRLAILRSLEGFNGRAWISHQVAEEFFRNRNGVIVSSGRTFNDADRNISDIKKSIEDPIQKLKSNRIIPDALAEKLDESLLQALDLLAAEVDKARGLYPNYRDDDPILNSICDLFKDAVGSPFNDAELLEASKEAKRRKDNKIPPGFKDSAKDGDKPFGDYFLWRQILNHIKNEKRPLIFVTSEQKDDWWEKRSGQIIGPQYELIKEFFEVTKQKFIFYRTDRFLEFALKRVGDKASSDAVNEIRAVAKQRNKGLTKVNVLSQDEDIGENDLQAGKIRINLTAPMYKFTCSGHLEPEMSNVPILNVELIESPIETPENSIHTATGTKFDFNVHIKSTEYGKHLPCGEYVFSYIAITDEIMADENEI